MDDRIRLHEELVALAGSSFHVYYQPPSNLEIAYPCIIYSRTAGDADHADNQMYRYRQQYQVIIVTADPDDDLFERILWHFPMSRPERHYSASNLHHDVISLYY
jgi:hypothetical protein